MGTTLKATLQRIKRRLVLVLDRAFAPEPNQVVADLHARIRAQQTTIWSLQARLNSLARENASLRAQMDELHQLVVFGSSLQPQAQASPKT